MTTAPLNAREQAVLRAMIEHGDAGSSSVTPQDRRRWLDQVPEARTVGRCSCGTCPSIELRDVGGTGPVVDRSRIVLAASSPGALLLLFIDDDLLSYLELAPTEDDTFDEFPPVEHLRFT